MIKLMGNMFMNNFGVICEQAIYGSPKLEKDSFVPIKYSFSHMFLVQNQHPEKTTWSQHNTCIHLFTEFLLFPRY